jgi:hypothetical protein
MDLPESFMAVQSIRPDVSNLTILSYQRFLHPELCDRHCSLTLNSSGMKLELQLNASGHLLSLHSGTDSLTEVIVDHRETFPVHGRFVDYRLRGYRTESAVFPSGLRYDMSCQLERLHLDVFLRMNEELEQDLCRADLSSRLPAVNRLLPGPLSLIRAEKGRGSFLVYAFHTFPEHGAIVKTQSLFEKNR